ncbi:MAG: PKD domain-containing protein [Tannerella sp.]|jgi:hypothetical protein|nr:PKD domain-containing protein [Tannerella sp.]
MWNARKRIIVLTGLLSVLNMSAQQRSPYISKVYDFCPAPGQFVNVSPEYESGDTREDILRKVEELLAGEESSIISLGAWGGYVVFGFDHPVVNVSGKSDFKVLGNVFVNAMPGVISESSEPGIVMVSRDANGNGLPDDPWYELAGSEHEKPATIRRYRITYYKPDENKTPVPNPDYPELTDTTYIRWTDNQGKQGYVARNKFHSQPYYPQWLESDSLIFEGVRLADNYRLDDGGNYLQFAYDYGYADNHPNTSALSEFNIEWAMDENGQPIHLPEIHFVKVYTGVNQYCGWLGEGSTEIGGAVDLHPEAVSSATADPLYTEQIRLMNNPVREALRIESSVCRTAYIYGLNGVRLMSFGLEEGMNTIACGQLPDGFYILVAEDCTIKFRKQ